MHELSIALSLVEVVTEQLALNGLDDRRTCAVAAVDVRIGVRRVCERFASHAAGAGAIAHRVGRRRGLV